MFLWAGLRYDSTAKVRLNKLFAFKQFVVTNCSKERPGSIVTKNLKNGSLIPIVTSKESHLMLILNIIFIKFSLTHQNLPA